LFGDDRVTTNRHAWLRNSYINEFQYENTILNNPTLLANVQPLTTYATDVANNTLPQFALIEPASDAGLDEHPSDSDEYPVNVQTGEAYAAKSVINPLMQNPASWANTALIFTYDEWGGLYDHVAPQPGDRSGMALTIQAIPAIRRIFFSGDICGGGRSSWNWDVHLLLDRIPYSYDRDFAVLANPNTMYPTM